MNTMPPRQILFTPKRPAGPRPWEAAGFPTEQEWQLWTPHICGICCLKMLVDTFVPAQSSLALLTARCVDLGGFRVEPDGNIIGVFHRPLLQLARELGLDGAVEGSLTTEALRDTLAAGKFAMLSINLARVRPDLSGGHLLLVHSYDGGSQEFIVHDCSEVLAIPGANVRVTEAALERISNRKGIILWPGS